MREEELVLFRYLWWLMSTAKMSEPRTTQETVLLGMLVGDYLDSLIWEKTHPNCGRSYSVRRPSRTALKDKGI